MNILSYVCLSAEQDLDIFVETSASVPSGVNDHPFLIYIFSKQFSVNLSETCVIHRLYMHISQTSARKAVNIMLTFFNPSVIEKAVHKSAADW